MIYLVRVSAFEFQCFDTFGSKKTYAIYSQRISWRKKAEEACCPGSCQKPAIKMEMVTHW